MRLPAIAATFALLTGPVYAQGFGMGSGESGGTKTRYTEEEKRAEKANERAYRDAIRNTRGETGESYDPWRNIRSTTPEKKPSR